MDDLISRQEAIDAIYHHLPSVSRTRARTMLHEVPSAQPEMVENLPTADPEIIRCKDCLMHGVCRFEQGLGLDGYCSQAERRTDE